MSLKENDVYLEQTRESILDALVKKDYVKVTDLVAEMKDLGLEDSAVEIWDEVSAEDRKDYLTWFDSK